MTVAKALSAPLVSYVTEVRARRMHALIFCAPRPGYASRVTVSRTFVKTQVALLATPAKEANVARLHAPTFIAQKVNSASKVVAEYRPFLSQSLRQNLVQVWV